MVEEKIITDKITDIFHYYEKSFPHKQILGTFTLGLVNYGFCETEEDLDFITIYIPSFEDICTNTVFTPIHTKEYGYFLDIRCAYNATETLEPFYLEMLFAKYYQINPKYKDIFKEKFFDNKELIGHYCNKNRLTSLYDRALSAYRENKYFEVARLYLSAQKFVLGYCIEACYREWDSLSYNHLLDLKHGAGVVNYSLLEDMIKWRDTASDEIQIDINILIKQGCIEIVKRGLDEGISFDSFKEILTTKEEEAFEAIYKELDGGKGNIIISKMITKTNISRPIYNNLIHKIEQYKIANIINQGVKGLYIEFLI